MGYRFILNLIASIKEKSKKPISKGGNKLWLIEESSQELEIRD